MVSAGLVEGFGSRDPAEGARLIRACQKLTCGGVDVNPRLPAGGFRRSVTPLISRRLHGVVMKNAAYWNLGFQVKSCVRFQSSKHVADFESKGFGFEKARMGDFDFFRFVSTSRLDQAGRSVLEPFVSLGSIPASLSNYSHRL